MPDEKQIEETKEISHKDLDKIHEMITQEIKEGWTFQHRYLDQKRNEFVALLKRAKRAYIGSKE
jgi:hypothetical protein